jgi:RND family efflux transporter MFP subunit
MGDRVQPGAKLLEIVPRRFQFSLSESEAALSQTLARLGLKEIPDRDFDVNNTNPVKKALSELENAESKVKRQTPLYEKGMIKEFEYIDALSARKIAQSALDATRDEANALLEQARQNAAQIGIRQKDLADATIIAPDGSTPGVDSPKITSYAVSSRKVSTGEYLREGTVLFTLVADSTLKLQARVPERHLGSVARGAQVKFHIEAYPGQTFEGAVSRIDPAVDPANRTFLLEALVENEAKYGGKLRPGSFVSQGEVLTKKEAGRIMVPLEAVTSFVGVMKVYVLEGQENGGKRVRAVEVTTGQQEGPWIEIIQADGTANPIKPGDLVVYEGTRKLVDGSLVRVKSEDATAAR